jgi:hypothetical protein
MARVSPLTQAVCRVHHLGQGLEREARAERAFMRRLFFSGGDETRRGITRAFSANAAMRFPRHHREAHRGRVRKAVPHGLGRGARSTTHSVTKAKTSL